MSDVSPWVPKHGLRPVGQQTCAFSPTGREEDYCGKPATWHVKWDASFDVSATCDAHMEVIQKRWVYDARHPVSADCNMPGALWFVRDNVCRVPADETVAAARRELATL